MYYTMIYIADQIYCRMNYKIDLNNQQVYNEIHTISISYLYRPNII